MRILLLGATGRVGSHLLKLAIDDGHQITAFVRDPSRLKSSSKNITVFTGNARNKDDIVAAAPHHDIIISALGTDGAETLSESMPHVISAMKLHNINRIITVGTAGILQSRISPELYRYQSSETKRRTPKAVRAARDHQMAYEQLANSEVVWTVVCPTYLPDEERQGKYRYVENFLPIDGEKISVADTADFTYSLIGSKQFLRTRVGLAY